MHKINYLISGSGYYSLQVHFTKILGAFTASIIQGWPLFIPLDSIYSSHATLVSFTLLFVVYLQST